MVRKILYFSVCVVLLLNLACLKVSANDDQAYDFEYILENECEPNKQEDGSVKITITQTDTNKKQGFAPKPAYNAAAAEDFI